MVHSFTMLLQNFLPGQQFTIERNQFEVDFISPSNRVAVLYALGNDGERIPDGYTTRDGLKEIAYKKAIISDTRFDAVLGTPEDFALLKELNDLL